MIIAPARATATQRKIDEKPEEPLEVAAGVSGTAAGAAVVTMGSVADTTGAGLGFGFAFRIT